MVKTEAKLACWEQLMASSVPSTTLEKPSITQSLGSFSVSRQQSQCKLRWETNPEPWSIVYFSLSQLSISVYCCARSHIFSCSGGKGRPNNLLEKQRLHPRQCSKLQKKLHLTMSLSMVDSAWRSPVSSPARTEIIIWKWLERAAGETALWVKGLVCAHGKLSSAFQSLRVKRPTLSDLLQLSFLQKPIGVGAPSQNSPGPRHRYRVWFLLLWPTSPPAWGLIDCFLGDAGMHF